jgi:hypothetical protein
MTAMTETPGNGTIDFFGDEAIRIEVEKLWAEVFSASNDVLKQAGIYGYYCMDFPRPNIHDMLNSLSIVSEKLKFVIDLFESGGVEYDVVRMALNARKQVLNLEFVAASLKAGNKDDFDAAVTQLRAQAVI